MTISELELIYGALISAATVIHNTGDSVKNVYNWNVATECLKQAKFIKDYLESLNGTYQVYDKDGLVEPPIEWDSKLIIPGYPDKPITTYDEYVSDPLGDYPES